MNKRHIIFITIAVTRFLKSIADSLFRNGKFVLIQAKYIDCMAVRPVYDTVFSKKTESIETAICIPMRNACSSHAFTDNYIQSYINQNPNFIY